ncbi:hypothetical protein HYT52_03390 [Candidatus Woesearchaeota archaeon]|nr:hypothetical protein [Candidatus Woesearchaeota archaeon]
MVNITRLAKKELRFIIREFIELERMLKLAKKGESAVPQECQRLLKLLQKGLRTEERIEYYSARQFFKLRKAIVRAGSGLTIQEGQKITELLRQAVIYDGFLKKLSSRGGEIEEKLSSLVKNPTLREMKELQQVLEEAISADRSFELLIQEIIKTMEGVKTTKSALLLEEMHPRLALLQSGSALILFDLEKVKDIFRMDARAKARAFGEEGRALVRKGQSAFAKRHLAERQAYHLEITAEQPVDGTGGMFDMPKLLTNEQDKIFKTAILGYCEFRNGYSNSDIFCGAMMTYRTAAKRGYGVLLYELAFSFASLNHRAVIGDRSEISTPARKIWER